MTEEGGDDNDHTDATPHVDHSYHDFSRYIQQGGEVPKHKKAGSNFPARLHHMLADPNNSHIIAWMPHGRAWKIVNKELFMSTLVPTYFGQTKFGSFTRQLNGWGFKRLHQVGPDYGCYYHQYFLRGLPKLTEMMRRVQPNQEDKGRAKRPNATGEPIFSLISRQYPLPHPMLPSRMASQPPAVVKSPTLLHHNNKCGSAQDQTALVKSAQAQAGSTAASVTASAPIIHRFSVADHSARDHVDTIKASSPTAAMKSDELLNYEPNHQTTNVLGNQAATSALPTFTSSSFSMPFGVIPMSYQQHLYQMQNIAQSGNHHWPAPIPAHSNIIYSSTHPSNTPVANSSRSHTGTDTTDNTTDSGSSRSGGDGNPVIKCGNSPLESLQRAGTLEQGKQAEQQAGYPPRSAGYALETSASTYDNSPAYYGGNPLSMLSNYHHQETTSTSAEQQSQDNCSHAQETQPQITHRHEHKGIDDESFDDDFIAFLTRL